MFLDHFASSNSEAKKKDKIKERRITLCLDGCYPWYVVVTLASTHYLF